MGWHQRMPTSYLDSEKEMMCCTYCAIEFVGNVVYLHTRHEFLFFVENLILVQIER